MIRFAIAPCLLGCLAVFITHYSTVPEIERILTLSRLLSPDCMYPGSSPDFAWILAYDCGMTDVEGSDTRW